MANVNIKFNNKDYLLSCDDGQEESLKELANHLDAKYNELKKNLGNIGESKLLLITAIQMVDDYFDLKKKVDSKKNDFEKLSLKFKELRSLTINYKEEKEKEIEKLKIELNKFKETIDDSRNSYEEVLEKNQLLREKEEVDKNYENLSNQYEKLKVQMEEINKNADIKFD